MRTSLICFSILVLAAGCTPLTSGGARVEASRSPPPSACKPVGDVTGRTGAFGAAMPDSDVPRSAMNDLRNETARRGGDYVYFSGPALGFQLGELTSASYGGRAYRCATDTASAATSAGGR